MGVTVSYSTRFGDDGGVLADPRFLTQATDVLTEDPKHVLVPHHQVRHGTAGSAVVLVHREPLLHPPPPKKKRTPRTNKSGV